MIEAVEYLFAQRVVGLAQGRAFFFCEVVVGPFKDVAKVSVMRSAWWYLHSGALNARSRIRCVASERVRPCHDWQMQRGKEKKAKY